MVSQNEILQSLDKRVDKIAEKIEETDDNLKVLSQKMQKHYRSLKAKVSQLDRDLRQIASHERKPKPVENSFFDPPDFPTYFKQPERPSPFYPTYVSSPPDQVRYIPTTYRPKSTRTATPSTSKSKGKASYLSASSSDSQDIPETPPPKIQKEEETHDKDSDNNSDQETSTEETPGSVSSKSKSKDNYIPRLFMANIKEEDSFFEEESPEETLIPERIKPNGGPWFTFDDIPPNCWRKRLLEFGAWLDTQMMKHKCR
ncbi:hypothetical protein KIW84_021476 [Lathyrus oleraceus]|uniref:t-SNARE coiled-coil homology domain-containing protein n=1 Tax=Pisum sativum TaxID=3888 RepID=A0A9D5B9D8_PEA|nr:hypothetical protein KIW84_021476 [Pisum sativum]